MIRFKYYKNVDLKQLEQQCQKGWLRKATSEDGKLVQYNYSNKAQYEKYWNRHTKNNRGHIYEIETGKLIAMSFPKFFNFSELTVGEQRYLSKNTDFTVFEKMDGCLGICYFYNGKWRVNSRGSFNSFASRVAEELLKKYPKIKEMNRNWTLLFEIIHPRTKIIVDYKGKKELCLIGGYSLDPLVEIEDSQLDYIAGVTGFSRPKKFNYSLKDIKDILTELDYNNEGFVVKFNNSERVKFKGDGYLKIVKILCQLTPKNLWKTMENGKVDTNIISTLPEEIKSDYYYIKARLERFYSDVKESIHCEYCDLKHQFSVITQKSLELGSKLSHGDCKVIAEIINESEYRHKCILFPYIKGYSIEKYLHKSIEPKGDINEIN